MAMTKIKGLQMWCRKMTEGYDHVDVANFTTAWRDGMAFCAIIHRFRPDLIDYDSLSPDNVYENCKLAFEVAEKELDIPAFLEADDMARLKVPDKLSVITYVSQYYNFLNSLPQLGGPGVKGKVTNRSTAGGKRPPNIDTSQAPSTKKSATNIDGKENISTGIEKSRPGTGGDKCAICQNRVYLLERHIEGGKLYHRSCFRHSELSPTNKVYTRSPFLSPALSAETPPLSPSHHTGAGSSDNHQHRAPGRHTHSAAKPGHTEASSNGKLLTPVSAGITAGSPRKVDGVGTKHSLAEPDREDSKKSKLQQGVGEDKQHKANAIKDRLRNLKEKYEVAKKADGMSSEPKKPEPKTSALKEKQSQSNAFPLSGKESRQLEKRREHILSTEKQAEKTPKGGTRSVPLIFRTDTSSQSSSASCLLSKAEGSSSPSSLSAQSSSTSSSTITSTPTTSKSTVTLNISKPEKKTVRNILKAEPFSKNDTSQEKEGPTTKDGEIKSVQNLDTEKNVHHIKSSDKLDIESLQRKFSASNEAGSSKTPAYPVAKQRTHKPSDTAAANTPAPPKAAPRKSLVVTIDKPVAPERGKVARQADSPSPRNPDSARSCSSSSPPPLPLTAPPPLPATPPPPQPGAKGNDTKADPISNNVNLTKAKVNLRSKNNDPTDVMSTHGPVKSQVATSSVSVASHSQHGNKRWSSPAIHDSPLAVFTTPQVSDPGEKQVLTGLLASLAGVRGRAGSVPGVTTLNSGSPPLLVNRTPSPSSPSPPPFLSKHAPPAPKSSFEPAKASLPSSEGSIASMPKTPAPRAVSHTTTNIEIKVSAQNSEPSKISSIVKISEPLKKMSNGPVQSLQGSEKLPEALSMLNCLKKVDNSKPSQSSTLNVKTSTVKAENSSNSVSQSNLKKNFLTASKENLNKVSTKLSEAAKQDFEKASSDSAFTNIKLKRVLPEPKNTAKISSTPAFDVQLKKVDNKSDNTPVKPPRSTSESSSRDQYISAVATSENVSSRGSEDKHERKRSEFNIQTSTTAVKSGGKSPRNSDDKYERKRSESVPSSAILAQSRPNRSSFFEEDELPDWKVALEERKRKLKQDAAKSAASAANVMQVRDRGGNTTDLTKSEDTLAAVHNERNNNLTVEVKNKVPRNKRTLSPDRSQMIDTKAEADQVKNMSSAAGKKTSNLAKKSNDWMHDAEMKIAALGGFDSEDDHEKVKTKPKRTLPRTPDQETPSAAAETKSITQVVLEKVDSKKEEKEKQTKLKKVVLHKKTEKEAQKETTPEFLVGKSQLRQVEIDIADCASDNVVAPGAKEAAEKVKVAEPKVKDAAAKVKDTAPKVKESAAKVKGTAPKVVKDSGTEDFREKLLNLKHVQGAGEGQTTPANASVDKPVSGLPAQPLQANQRKQLTRPLSLSGGEKNTNNNMDVNGLTEEEVGDSMEEQREKSLLETINLSSSQEMSENDSGREKSYSEQRHSTPVQENGKEAPAQKTKRRIPFFGKKKKDKPASPKESPISTKKKIEVPVHFDFDKSSDMESSMVDGVAKLTIEDQKTPPHRPPPPQPNNRKIKSPGHISAIELQQQLLDIDSRLTDLELRGRDLEDSIRNVNVLEDDDDSLMIKWFELVSEKNDLVREEADLVYMSREQDLETEREHIESQLRYLMSKSDEAKSAAEREEEDYLIQRKLELVEQRNRIVDSMDEDRLRYEEEDRDIEVTLRDKGLWKDSNGTLKAIKGKRVSNSTFYA